MTIQGRKLIIDALGDRRADENLKAYLRRGSVETGLGFASMIKCWQNKYISKRTISKLQQKAADNEHNVAEMLEAIQARASRLQNCPGELVDQLGAMAARLRNLRT